MAFLSGIITVLGFLFLLFLYLFFFDRLQFYGIDSNNFEVSAAFWTRHNFSFIDLLFVDVEIISAGPNSLAGAPLMREAA